MARLGKRINSINLGIGKDFTFHGSFLSQILARRREREIPGSFIIKRGNRYYVIRPIYQKANPAWTPPFTKRKRKRLGVLYQKAFAKFSKENPRRKGVVIYGRVLKIFAQKTSGPYKGQQFVHTFKWGAVMVGMPDGSLRIMHS